VFLFSFENRIKLLVYVADYNFIGEWCLFVRRENAGDVGIEKRVMARDIRMRNVIMQWDNVVLR